MSPIISQLFIYPIKSCSGISVPCIQFDHKGPLFDRRWMLVDRETGVFLSQREISKMALISTSIVGGRVWARQSINTSLDSAFILPVGGELVDVTVWSDHVQGYDCGDQAATWFSQLIDHDCRLVFQGGLGRLADEKYTDEDAEISFADGFPLLVVNQSSIDLLNGACSDAEIAAENFRPNIVVKDSAAFSEKSWSSLSTDSLDMKVVKACERCVIPTINPKTGEREKSILPVLLKYCRANKKLYFGQNLTFKFSEGAEVSIGQLLKIQAAGI